MDSVKIYKKPRLKNAYLIAAWPGMGEVAFRAASHLVEKLKAQEFASIAPGDYFYHTGSIIDEGVLSIPPLPESKFYFWKNPANKEKKTSSGGGSKKSACDLIIFLSNAQPDLAKAHDYSKKIIAVAKALKVKTVISLASMPQAIDHTQQPGIWFAATDRPLREQLSQFQINPLAQGQISGMNGLFLGLAKEFGLRGFSLLAEIPLYTIQIENPKAAYYLLQALSRIIDISVEQESLLEQSSHVEQEINKLLDFFKLGTQPGGSNPIGEDEIEKIKKTLGQLTKLPVSVKQKIDGLFEQAKQDISKANELKIELDKWNVYKEYEDKFLDLFKKKEGQDN